MMRTRIKLTVMTFGSSLISFLAYTLLMRHLGSSARLDLLFYAASVPSAFTGVTSGVLLYMLPSRFTQVEPQVQESILRVLFCCFALICAIFIVGGFVYGILYGWTVLVAFWVGFILVALLTLLSTLAVCIAQARGAYLDTGIASIITSVGLFIGVSMAIAFSAEWWFLVGQLLGSVAAVLWLSGSIRLSSKWCWRDMLLASGALSPLKPYAVDITMGTMAFTLFQPIDAALCTQLGNGSVSVMSYAQRVLVAVGTAVSFGAYTMAARTSTDSLLAGGQAALLRLANREVLRIVIFGLMAWMIYSLGGGYLFGMILGSSEMSGQNLVRLIDCVQWMLLGVGPMAAIPYIFRVFYSQQAYRKPAILGICVAPAYGLFAWLLLPRFDILALAYAYSFIWWFTLTISILWLNQSDINHFHSA